MSNEKRKKVVVSVRQKIEALTGLDKGRSVQKAEEGYCIGYITIDDWKRKRSKIEKWFSTRASNGGLKNRKAMEKFECQKVSDTSFLWFIQQQGKGTPITVSLYQAKC
jgi:hypothetical protein